MGKKRENNKAQQEKQSFIEFARELLKLKTFDPKRSSAKKNRTYSLYSKENIINWLQNPSQSSNEKNLREASSYMYLSSMQYRRLLSYYAGLYTGSYVVSPLDFNKDDVKDNFKKQYRKVSKALDLMGIPYLMKTSFLVALREGAFYGVLLSDNNSAFVQQIDPDYCKITSICDGSFLYSVDMTKIADKLEYYPREFTTMYANYQATKEQWQEVPVDICWCIKCDDSMPDITLPPFAAVMPTLYDLASTQEAQAITRELRNYKMLAGQIPLDSKGNPVMDANLVKKYYQQIANAVDDNVGVAITPFKLESFGFENKSGTVDIDDFSNATSNFWATAGTSGLLHGKENNTSGVTKLAIKNDETFILPMLHQFERLLNRYLKTCFSGSTRFKVAMLPITVFNREEYLTTYKEAASFGVGKSYYVSALGIPQSDMAGLCYLEDTMMDFDKLTPLKSTYQSSGNTSGSGRPKTSDAEITPEGEATRDKDTNSNK